MTTVPYQPAAGSQPNSTRMFLRYRYFLLWPTGPGRPPDSVQESSGWRPRACQRKSNFILGGRLCCGIH